MRGHWSIEAGGTNIGNVDALRSGLQKYRAQTCGSKQPRPWTDVARDIREWDKSGRLGASDRALAERLRTFVHSERALTTPLREVVAVFLGEKGLIPTGEQS